MFQELVNTINARESVPLSEIKRGGYCKIGSNCPIVVSKRKTGIRCDRVGIDGLRSNFGLNLSADLPVKPMLASEAETAVKLRREECIKPFEIMEGLRPALAIYLKAERLVELE